MRTQTHQQSIPLPQQGKRIQTARATPVSQTVLQDYIYDDYGRITTEKTTGADGFIANIQYAYDPWGYVNKVTNPGAASDTAGRYVNPEALPFRGIDAWYGTTAHNSLTYPQGAWTGYVFHTHLNMPSFVGMRRTTRERLSAPNVVSQADKNSAARPPNVHLLGWDGGLAHYNHQGIVSNIAGAGWWFKLKCDDIL